MLDSHVILPEKYYDLLPEPEDNEKDMLNMAFGLTDTSYLGCQVKLTKEFNEITCRLPSAMARSVLVGGEFPLSFSLNLLVSFEQAIDPVFRPR